MSEKLPEAEHLMMTDRHCNNETSPHDCENSIEIEDFHQKKVSRLAVLAASTVLLLMVTFLSMSIPSRQTANSLYAETDCGIVYETSDKKCNAYESPVLGGMDVVEYFDEIDNTDLFVASDDFSATSGHDSIVSTFAGYNFYFSSSENKQLFDQNPVKYIPKFGGFCAYGISGYDGMNYLHSESQLWSVPVDPNQYAVVNGGLYLFRGSGAKELFVNNSQTNIKGGESMWTKWFGNCTGYFNTQCFMAS